ncbi:MAG: ACP S-malonyltransferase [Legionellales bacterium]|jgi:[acyl-carrier-protein] S-malonyltransferase
MQKTAFIFPGQGSQSLGMLSAFADYPQIKNTFAIASRVLNYDLWDLVQNGPDVKLNETQYTQPAILTASYALWKIWNDEQGIKPSLLAGHSLGEYSALVAAESLSFEDAVLLVAKRGQFMQEAVPEGVGAMAAVLGLSDDEVKNICEKASENEVLSAVNFNAPGQVVIAGNKAALTRALDLIKQAGKRALPLPVSVPSHCLLMKPAAEQLALALESVTICSPQIPVVNNVNVTFENDPDAIKLALIQQLYSPVRWVETIQLMSQTCKLFIECGPGKVLTGLNKRINGELMTYPIGAPDLLNTALGR